MKKKLSKIDKLPKIDKIPMWTKYRYDAMTIYLEKHDWLILNQTTGLFDIKKHLEVFKKTDNLEFEEAISAVIIYEKEILKRK